MGLAYCYQKNNLVMVAIKLSPKSAKDQLMGVCFDQYDNAYLDVKIRAIPEKGQANVALIAFMAKQLRIPKSNISLAAGSTSRYKTLQIEDDFQAILQKLSELLT